MELDSSNLLGTNSNEQNSAEVGRVDADGAAGVKTEDIDVTLNADWVYTVVLTVNFFPPTDCARDGAVVAMIVCGRYVRRKRK